MGPIHVKENFTIGPSSEMFFTTYGGHLSEFFLAYNGVTLMIFFVFAANWFEMFFDNL
jgi:hypothetical protein